MGRLGCAVVLVLSLVIVSDALPEFDQQQAATLIETLANVAETYNTKISIGLITCKDTAGPTKLSIVQGEDYITLKFASVYLKGNLDYENSENQNKKDVRIQCTTALTGNSVSLEAKIVIKDRNDNPPIFDRAGQTNGSYQVTIKEILDTPLNQPIYDSIIVSDKDGVDNNLITAKCLRVLDTDSKSLPCDQWFSLKSVNLGAQGQYKFEVYALTTDFSMHRTLTINMAAVNTPTEISDVNRVIESPDQNILVTIQDIQNQPPEIDQSVLSFKMFENLSPGSPVEPGRYLSAFDQDVGDPNPLNFTLAPTLGDTYAFDNGFFELGPREVDPNGANSFFYRTELRLKKSIDREQIEDASKTVRVDLVASEIGGPERNPMTARATISVRILDVNDEVPTFNENEFTISLSERIGIIANPERFVQISTKIDVQVEDNDSILYNSYTVKIISGNEGKNFKLNKETGLATDGFTISALEKVLDYEVQPNYYELKLKAMDNADNSLTSTAIVKISITDENDNPPEFDKSQYIFEVAENADIGKTVGTVRATDKDTGSNGQIVGYTLFENSNTFTIEANGNIVLNKKVDYETRTSYSFTVRAQDGGFNPDRIEGEAQVTVSVKNINDVGPQFTASYVTQVNEESTELIPSVTVEAQSQETTDSVSYTITKVDPDSIPISQFSVGTTSGVFTLVRPLDHKQTRNSAVVVQVTAYAGGLSSSTNIIITVIDLNNFAPVFVPQMANNIYRTSISELTQPGEKVFDLNVTDADGEDTNNGKVDFQVLRGANDDFVIKSLTGVIQVSPTARLDIHLSDVTKTMEYEIVVVARDRGNPVKSSTATVIVSLLDANNLPPYFETQLYLFQMHEQSDVNTPVGTVLAKDRDTNYDIVYSIDYTNPKFEKKGVSINDNTIDISKILSIGPKDGIIRVAGLIDRTKYDRINFDVIAEDVNADKSFTRKQTGVASVLITILAAVDPDIYFALPWTKTNPFIVTTYSESSSFNFQILTLKATDPSIPELITNFREVPGTDQEDFFSIEGRFVYLKKPLDYEKLPGNINKMVTVVVEGINRYGNKSSTATIQVRVQDLNDNAPAFEDQNYVFSVEEDKRYAYELGTIKATDADSTSFGNVEYFLSGVQSDHFAVYSRRSGSDNIAVLHVAEGAELDYESTQEYNIQLTAKDNPKGDESQRLYTTITLKIEVTDKNDNPPIFPERVYEFSVIGTKEVGEDVGFLLADDKDSGINRYLTYSGVSTDGGSTYFGVDTDLQTSARVGEVLYVGRVFVRRSLENLSDRAQFELTVTAQDGGQVFLTGTTIVRITVSKGVQDPKPKWDSNLPSRVLIFEHSPYYPKNDPPTFVANITANPANDSSSIVYQFVEAGIQDGDFEKFRINPTTGTIVVAADLDYETQKIYSADGTVKLDFALLILATDASNSTYTNQYLLVVQVKDINDNVPLFNSCADITYEIPETARVKENSANGTYVYRALACDLDEAPNNAIAYSWFFEANDPLCPSATSYELKNVFSLETTTGIITTKGQIDREVHTEFLLCVEASPATPSNTRRKRDLAADLKKRKNHGTVLYVRVIIDDDNDQRPVFLKDSISRVIVKYPDVEVAVAEAVDNDLPPNNEIRYSIEQIHFTINGKVQNAPTAFSINANDGAITIGTNDYSDYVGGFFSVKVRAEDRLNSALFDTQMQFIMVTNKENQVRLVFNRPADIFVHNQAKKMVEELNRETTDYYEIEKISYHVISNAETPQFDKTDVCLVIVRQEAVLTAVDAAKTMTEQTKVTEILNKYGAVDPGPCNPARSIYPKGWESYWWVLVAFAIFIFVCVLILIIIICALHRHYRRYMKTERTYLKPN